MSRMTELAKRSDATTLILGETGTGKTRLARELHESGPRRAKPFVTVNLATLHEGTLESELFGHERGAFTGADQRRIGRLELASGGTVFLDEIGELPARLQTRLLEFLQSKTVVPVGGSRETRLDVRIIAATHKDLDGMVRRREFREDLFHRLRILSITLPPLRERPAEFDRLVHQALEEACAASGRKVLRLAEETAIALERHPWPGNLRELRNALEFAALASDGPEVMLSDLPSWLSPGETRAHALEPSTKTSENPLFGTAEIPLSGDFNEAIAHFERLYLLRALGRNRGRINRTAKQIGMSKATLIRRVRAYGIDVAAC